MMIGENAMLTARQSCKIGIVAATALSMGGCASVGTVNGVNLNSPPSDPCHGQVVTCILVGGVVVGGAALLLAGRSKRTSPNSTGGAGGSSGPTTTGPAVPPATPTTTNPIGPASTTIAAPGV